MLEQVENKQLHVNLSHYLSKFKLWMILIIATLKIGILGFGGGSALIPVIEEEFVRQKQVLTFDEYKKIVIAACITPGALPVDIAAGIGKIKLGGLGMVILATIMAIPGTVLTILFLKFLTYGDVNILKLIQNISLGLCALIITLLLSYVVRTLAYSRGSGEGLFSINLFVIFIVFMATGGVNLIARTLGTTRVFSLSVLEILLLAFFTLSILGAPKVSSKNKILTVATVMIIYFITKIWPLFIYSIDLHNLFSIFLVFMMGFFIIQNINHQKNSFSVNYKNFTISLIKDICIWCSFILLFILPILILYPYKSEFLISSFISTVLSFGGGDAYLTLADGMFVATGQISSDIFYSQLVPVANILPGSILCKMLTGIGYEIGYEQVNIVCAYLMALAGFAISVGASGLTYNIVVSILDHFHKIQFLQDVSKWINPIISGLLLNVALAMGKANLNTGMLLHLSSEMTVLITVGLIILTAYLLFKYNIKIIMLMGISILTGLATMFI